MALTGGAMPVAAAVVAQVQASAAGIVAAVYMASQCLSAAFAQVMQGPCLPVVAAILKLGFLVGLQHLRHLMGSADHGYLL
jgi:hypothetical protein